MPHPSDADREVAAIDHIILAVSDLAEAETVYSGIFGRTPSWRGGHPGGGTSNVLYRLENTYVELLAATGEGPNATAVSTFIEEKGEGVFGIALQVTNAESAREAFAVRGLPVGKVATAEGVDEMTGAKREWKSFFIDRQATRGLTVFAIEHLSPADALPMAPLGAGVREDEAVQAADHVVVMTPDAEAVKTLFEERVNIRLALDHSKPEWGVRQLFFRTGGMTLEVVQPLDETRAPKKDHFWGLAWKAHHINAVQARLAAQGYDMSDVKTGRKKGSFVATIRKPTCNVPTILIGEAG
ncbi:VOC family protein [Parvibaculum sp.]|uniref:VOC family protein n=1 Tax=Parvibaculum sp. TaxID=2024848 RepID=UPI000C93AB49|nr:VOC family protein [Parvibaculum sp.]MAB13465.1 hypothetical protein [Parvibaculum sp.]